MKVAQLHTELCTAIRESIRSGATTQQQLARATFLSQGYISAVLAGKKSARAVVLDELAEAAGVRIEARISGPRRASPQA